MNSRPPSLPRSTSSYSTEDIIKTDRSSEKCVPKSQHRPLMKGTQSAPEAKTFLSLCGILRDLQETSLQIFIFKKKRPHSLHRSAHLALREDIIKTDRSSEKCVPKSRHRPLTKGTQSAPGGEETFILCDILRDLQETSL
ncbi:hypothetical protein CEXT_135051 [Caerostris extrusa]|uniref:Uncharacterized protein n=1 Tax=Caerostris extrusa TaxID=172846 RepID=A0AAV4XPX2_CAEEX|nr:hypothetical protein CEXT_135051 [Caerostris extrusa]